ncbi:unnamed protein product [Lepeophtheirus salmonis]|uniref:(salmon louse) hypothetical protein n=1 Tax=Lepeophtheirus salmonis TaxID=72036 RepID=A0A0K2VFK2_LEPSM|nr:unnamed protein product [Lepeophtheirus salmonis]CAF2948708.1 unnamed protein product [Lepeophtheirus salmonis]
MKYLVLSIFFVIALQQIDAAVVGAFETVADLNEAYEVVQETVPLIMSHFGADQSRCALYIRQIINAQQQIVSGANFRFDLELQSGGEECRGEIKLCKGIQVFRPLPYQCQDRTESYHCLELSRNSNIECVPLSY